MLARLGAGCVRAFGDTAHATKSAASAVAASAPR